MSWTRGALQNYAASLAEGPTDYMGIVYAKPPPARPDLGGNWYSFTFRNRAALVDWYNGWEGSPTLYYFLAAFDKTTPAGATGAPIAWVTDDDAPAQISGGRSLRVRGRADLAPASGRPMRARGRAEAVGAGLLGTGWLANPIAEIDDIDHEAHALEDQLTPQLSAPFKVAYVTKQSLAPFAGDKLAAFYLNAWRPWLEKWQAYRDDHVSLAAKGKAALGLVFARDAYFDAQPWRDQLREKWAAAQAAGFHLIGEPPKGADKSAESGLLDEVKSVGKVVLWGGVGVLGLLAVVAIANVAHDGAEPATR